MHLQLLLIVMKNSKNNIHKNNCYPCVVVTKMYSLLRTYDTGMRGKDINYQNKT